MAVKKKSVPKYNTIVVSDVHIGMKSSNASVLNNFLKYNPCNRLIIAGDLIDGWELNIGSNIPADQLKLVKRILKLSIDGTEVIYVTGNHDEFMRASPISSIGDIKVYDEVVIESMDGKRYVIIHGDKLDSLVTNHRLLSYAGMISYDFLLWFRKVTRYFGIGQKSILHYIKDNIGTSIEYTNRFESLASNYATIKGCDGVICGHIHVPVIKEIGGVSYMNSGDWVENNSVLVEDFDGKWTLIQDIK